MSVGERGQSRLHQALTSGVSEDNPLQRSEKEPRTLVTRTPGCVIVVSVPSITVVMAATASFPAALFGLVSTTEGGTITIYGVNDSTMNQGYDILHPREDTEAW